MSTGPPSPWQKPRGGCERAGLSQARGSGPCSLQPRRGWVPVSVPQRPMPREAEWRLSSPVPKGLVLQGADTSLQLQPGPLSVRAEGTRALSTTRPLPSCQQQGGTPRRQTGEWFWCKGLRFLKACPVFPAVSVALRRDAASP